ncbi:hypothetical protein AB0B21_20480 [Streptomyces rimosus]|uniref:hypothetical protein n=1 Tax=Streptomyces TaxID=1883 RepID=UPI000B2F3EE2|nr:hypothetical protein [Streptomyces rimosus]
MDVPLWLFLAAIGALGIKYARPPMWLVVVLLAGGVLLAGSFLGGPISAVLGKP